MPGIRYRPNSQKITIGRTLGRRLEFQTGIPWRLNKTWELLRAWCLVRMAYCRFWVADLTDVFFTLHCTHLGCALWDGSLQSRTVSIFIHSGEHRGTTRCDVRLNGSFGILFSASPVSWMKCAVTVGIWIYILSNQWGCKIEKNICYSWARPIKHIFRLSLFPK